MLARDANSNIIKHTHTHRALSQEMEGVEKVCNTLRGVWPEHSKIQGGDLRRKEMGGKQAGCAGSQLSTLTEANPSGNVGVKSRRDV